MAGRWAHHGGFPPLPRLERSSGTQWAPADTVRPELLSQPSPEGGRPARSRQVRESPLAAPTGPPHAAPWPHTRALQQRAQPGDPGAPPQGRPCPRTPKRAAARAGPAWPPHGCHATPTEGKPPDGRLSLRWAVQSRGQGGQRSVPLSLPAPSSRVLGLPWFRGSPPLTLERSARTNMKRPHLPFCALGTPHPALLRRVTPRSSSSSLCWGLDPGCWTSGHITAHFEAGSH